ncbi:MAG: PEGA domain-containing protein [Polyangiales bacterium]|jgi:outer membrane lipoprotein-sorting protein
MGVRAAGILLALVLLGCAKQGTVAPEPARLKVVATPRDASVYIDGHYFGRATVLSQEPKALAPGVHLMTVTADDHFPHDMELDLPRGTTSLSIELRPVPP